MTESTDKHSVYIDESLDPDDQAYMAYCTCGWTGPWLTAAQFQRSGVVEAHNAAERHGEDHLDFVGFGTVTPLRETA